MRYGSEGYAIYWYCLELIAGDLGNGGDINFDLKHDAEVIGYNLKIDTMRVEEIMTYMVSIGLFKNSQGTISCLKLAKYLDKKTTRNKTIHSIIDAAGGLAIESQTVPDSPIQSVTVPDRPEASELDTDTDTEKPLKPSAPVGAPSKSHKSLRFDEWWAVYPTKRDKKKARAIWDRRNLDAKAVEIVADTISRKEKDSQWLRGFVPYPTTYLNGDRWEDELETGDGSNEAGGRISRREHQQQVGDYLDKELRKEA